MRQYLLITTAILLAGCTPRSAHINYGDIASVFAGKRHYSHTYEASREDCAVHAAWAASKRASEKLHHYKVQLTNAQDALSKNRAWQNASCVQVAMQELPPRPKTLTENEIAFESLGSCVDSLSRRLPMTDVIHAFHSLRKEDYLKTGALWTKRYKEGHREPCSDQQTSLWNDWFIRMCGGFGPEALASCMDAGMNVCVEQITKSCRAPLTNWEHKIAFLKKEPEVLFQQCQRHVEDIAQAEREIPNAEVTAQINKQEYQRHSKKGKPVPSTACRNYMQGE
jgi:hypothetical protein